MVYKSVGDEPVNSTESKVIRFIILILVERVEKYRGQDEQKEGYPDISLCYRVKGKRPSGLGE